MPAITALHFFILPAFHFLKMFTANKIIAREIILCFLFI